MRSHRANPICLLAVTIFGANGARAADPMSAWLFRLQRSLSWFTKLSPARALMYRKTRTVSVVPTETAAWCP